MAVIYADVLTRLDERSARAAAEELEKQFSEVSARVGTETSDRLGQAFTTNMPGHGKDAAEGFMGGLADGISGELGGVTSALSGVTTAMRGVGAGGAAAGAVAAAGIAAIAVAAIKAGEALYGVGQRFDAMADTVAVRTGKMGSDLDGLTDSIRNVSRETASSLEAVADIGSRVSQSLNLSGAPLEDLTKQIADLNRMTGETLDIRQFGMMLRGFGEDGRMAGENLDTLAAASQRTGIPLGDLVGSLQGAGPAARQLGLDLDETAGMIVAFEKAGIDADKTTAGLNRAVQQFAEHNINLSTGLQDTVTQIRGFIDAGNEAAAVDLAGKVFGTRSAQLFVDAIKQGTLNLDTLQGGLDDTAGTIDDLSSRTEDWSEQWDILKNRVSDLAAEVGGPLFSALNSALGVMNSILTPQNAYPSSAPPWAAPGTPLTPQNLPGILGGPATSNTPSTLDGILLPSDSAVPGQVIPPWMPLPDPTRQGSPQDIAAALAEEERKKKAGLPTAPQLPYEAGYGQPPAPGESQEQWQARMADMAAQHDLAEKRARLTQLEQTNTATADDLISAKNAVIEAEMRSWQTQQRYLETRTQQLQLDISVPYSDAYGSGPRPGQTSSQYSAESSFYEAQHKTAQAAATYQALMAGGTATTAQLADAHNNLVKAQRDENEASLRLSESYKQTSEQMGEIGNQLDSDLGISKGLAGIAENLTRFLAGLAFAPVIGALKGVQAANGGYDANSMGAGMMGLAGLSMGMGPQAAQSAGMPMVSTTYPTPIYSYRPVGGPSPMTGYAPPSAAVTGGAYPGDAALLAQVPRGGSYDATGDLSRGLADCTSGLEDLVNMIDGQSTAGREMTTSNAGQWLSSRGFMPVPQGTTAPIPGAFNVGFWDGPDNKGHAEGTLPDGTNINFGSDAAVASGGTLGAAGAFGDPAFTSHYYRPMSTSTPSVSSGGGASAYGSPGASASAGGGGGGYAPMSPAELTNPGLSNPTLSGGGTGGGIGPGMAGLPQFSPFGPAAGSPVGGPASPGQSVMGGRAYGQGTPASPGLGFGGGLIGLAGSAATTAIAAGGLAADASGAMGGGSAGAMVAAAAAQIGIQELQRAVGAGAQYAGAIAGGVLETFSLNDSALGDPSKSWLGKTLGVVAGVRPSLPNTAGKEGGAQNPNMAEGGKEQEQPPGPLTPEQSAEQKAADAANGGQGGGTTNTVNNNVSVTNQGATEDYTGQAIQAHLGAQATAGQPR